MVVCGERTLIKYSFDFILSIDRAITLRSTMMLYRGWKVWGAWFLQWFQGGRLLGGDMNAMREREDLGSNATHIPLREIRVEHLQAVLPVLG